MTETSGLLSVLRPIRVRHEQLFLDPNNLRLLGIHGYRSAHVQEERITEYAVQQDVYETMIREPIFDVKSLYDSIEEIGFLPIDRIIVRKIGDTDNYVVLEGNRRLSAIKWLIFDHNRGEITLSEYKLDSMCEINVIEYHGLSEREKIDKLILQGSRHLSGVKDWGPFEKATAIMGLLNDGKSATEVGAILSISAIEVNRFKRGYQALKQWSDDDEYGKFAVPDMFNIIQTVTTQPYLRDEWLQWSESDGRFEDESNVKLLYGWICPSEDLGGRRKISDVRYIRSLPEILNDEEAYSELLEPDRTIVDAYAIIITKKKQEKIDFKQDLRKALRTLQRLPVDIMIDPNEVSILEQIQKLVTLRIEQSRRLLNG